MLNLLSSLTKAAVAVAVTPVAVIADVAKLPSSAYTNDEPFKHTSEMLQAASDNVKKAVDPNT